MASKNFTITLTANQASIILRALENESMDDPEIEDNPHAYSYWRCYVDFRKKLRKGE